MSLVVRNHLFQQLVFFKNPHVVLTHDKHIREISLSKAAKYGNVDIFYSKADNLYRGFYTIKIVSEPLLQYSPRSLDPSMAATYGALT